MKDFFYQLSDQVYKNIRANEWCELYFSSESTDFVRINQSKIRQPGHVQQHFLTLRLGSGNKKLSTTMTISTNLTNDLRQILHLLSSLRSEITQIPDDPYLVHVTAVTQNEHEATNALPSHEQAIDALCARSKALDLVGLYTSGGLYRGFSNSHGQRNWFSSYSFQLDWSLFREKDNALKSSFMGTSWNAESFENKWHQNMEQFEMLRHSRKKLSPGTYRIFLSPSAMEEVTKLLSFGGFSIQGIKNKVSPFLKLEMHEEHFNPNVNIQENIALGIAPMFNTHGDMKPDHVSLIQHGEYAGSLVSSRSSKEFKIPSNAAEDQEFPTSLEVQSGSLAQKEALKQLHTGIYINNLWYMNYSDRSSCRTTGMTRFATFWVENGQLQHPIQVIRFDESLFQAFGKNLEALTKEQELILSSDTYNERKAHCSLLPGALINDFNFCQ